MDRSYYIVDAFASEPFTGNPAAVVLDGTGLADDEMLRIAAEFNLSETTFILPPKVSNPRDGLDSPSYSVRFRWFTPTVEVDMCGHATIAGIHALYESGRVTHDDPASSTKVRVETRSGVLTGFIESIPKQKSGVMIWLELIPPVLTPHEIATDQLAASLGLPPDAFDADLPRERSQDGDLLVFVRDVMALNDARPDFATLARLLETKGLRGLCLSTVNTLTPSVNVQSRFFAPSVGVDEDPITGSVHGPLAAYLVVHELVPVHEGVAGMTCVQSKAGGRGGLLHALVQTGDDGGRSVRIGGRAITTMRGRLVAPGDTEDY